MFSYPSVKATCSSCSDDVMLTIDEIHVYVQELGGEGSYIFTCPHCKMITTRLAAACTTRALMNAGCLYTVGTISPIDLDMVIDFHYILQDDEAIREAFFEN
jgi:hypothetical protein